MKRLYSEKIAPHEKTLPGNILAGINLVCDEPFYAFMAPDFSVAEIVPVLHCNVTTVPEAFIPGTVGMAISKTSLYLEVLRYM